MDEIIKDSKIYNENERPNKSVIQYKISKKVAKFAFLFFFLKGIGWIIIFWFGWKTMN